ncbi:hypothetical protein [Streptomyces fuscichromogenes]|uniref:Uncharacterized protein n=1 Tax=Streptomyces fuscichromogenes TaxID=1324013 RepID=A0A918CR93_9ACTN|nr:hypothetical protein [Streptomyces fuscichromogenes]GGN04414.1 hypothetical protein GCM10011578_027600 [Streptomyces fuscichromogenes]
MNITHLHRRLLPDLLSVGAAYPLALTGDYAAQAHGLFDRPGRSVDAATQNPRPMPAIAEAVAAGLRERGWHVVARETDPLSAQLVVTDPVSAEESEVTLVKEAFWHPPVRTELGPALALEDVVGMRVWALTDRGLPRDLLIVHTAADRWSLPDLEDLGRRHARDTFDLTDLQSRLTGTDWIDDREFSALGLDAAAVSALRRWAQTWADDIAERLIEAQPPED